MRVRGGHRFTFEKVAMGRFRVPRGRSRCVSMSRCPRPRSPLGHPSRSAPGSVDPKRITPFSIILHLCKSGAIGFIPLPFFVWWLRRPNIRAPNVFDSWSLSCQGAHLFVCVTEPPFLGIYRWFMLLHQAGRGGRVTLRSRGRLPRPLERFWLTPIWWASSTPVLLTWVCP
jgi:hypothetical protein